MKVLQVTTHFNIGGITNYILSLSRALRWKGVHTIVATSGGNMETDLAVSEIPHKKLDIDTKFEFGPKMLKSAFRIKDMVEQEKVDLMHAHSRVSQVACRIASSLTGVPYVTTCHGYFKKRSRGIVDTWGDKVIAISDAVKDHLINDLGVGADRIAVIYNGVDLDRFSVKYYKEEVTAIRKSLGLTDGPVIGTIGRLSPVKGQKFLIYALGDIVKSVPDASAIIVGGGEEMESLKNLAKSLRLEGRVVFVRSDPDTPKYLSLMDIFVFPSVMEGLGLALLEAMAFGLPCVASEVGGISDVMKDGSGGMLVPPENPEAIADAVLRLIGNPKMAEDMGLKGKKIVTENFSLDKMADSILKLYGEIIK